MARAPLEGYPANRKPKPGLKRPQIDIQPGMRRQERTLERRSGQNPNKSARMSLALRDEVIIPAAPVKRWERFGPPPAEPETREYRPRPPAETPLPSPLMLSDNQ